MATCRGIDVSVYQGPQDWAAHKAAGVAFAFAKASEGEHTRDAHFTEHITGIKKAGLVPGAYHYAWPCQNVALEAANYVAAVKPHAGAGFVHWLDLERRSDGANYAGRSAAQIRAWAAAWIAAVQQAFPDQRVGVYTSGDDLAEGHVPNAPLWYPAYPGSSVDTYAEAEKHAQPKPGGHTPLIWQFTSNPATGPNLDLSICYKSATDLRTWAGGTTGPTRPAVSLARLDQAARTDPHAAQGHQTYATGVHLVEAALLELGYLTSKYAHDGSFGTATVTAYAKWQRHLGYSGTAADGIPGRTSLTKLGAQSGLFTVTS
jgi:GH25 family lysozyme M1 (1,4-beta-N-acetylmuramidase)